MEQFRLNKIESFGSVSSACVYRSPTGHFVGVCGGKPYQDIAIQEDGNPILLLEDSLSELWDKQRMATKDLLYEDNRFRTDISIAGCPYKIKCIGRTQKELLEDIEEAKNFGKSIKTKCLV